MLDSSNYFLKRCRIMQNPLYRRFPTVLCVLKKTYCTHTHARAHSPMWKVTEDNKDGAMTREQPLTSWYHHCVTFVLHPRISSEEREKKKKSLFRHMRNICLLESRWAPQRGRRRGRNKKKKKGRERQKGAAAVAAAAVPSCHLLDRFCWHILRQPARSPPATPALNTLPPPHPAPQ